MNDPLTTAAAVVLVAVGVAADLALARLFINDWRYSSPRRRTRRLATQERRPLRTQPPTDRSACAVAAAAVLAASVHCSAFAQSDGPALDPGKLTLQALQPEGHQAAGTLLPPDPPPLDAAPPSLSISTDRPSFSDGAGVEPVGHLNLETGYTFIFRDRAGIETQRHNGPEVLVRIGIIDDRLELRALTSGYAWTRSDDGSGSGFISSEGWSDAALGIKLKLLDQDGWIPRLALGAQTSLAAGSDNVSSQLPEPTLKLIWSYDLARSFGEKWTGFTLGGNANVAWTSTSGDRFVQGQGSIYLAFPIADGLSGFAEYYVLGPNSKEADAAHYLDFGGAWLLTPRIQLDARAGFGLNHEADNLFVGVGISFLF